MKNIVNALPKVVIVGFVLCLLAILSLNCVEMPLSPVAPMSDIKLEGISLIDLTRTFADFLVKDTTLIRNSDGTSSYIKSQTLAPQGIPAIILQPHSSSEQVGVGLFSVGSFSIDTNYFASDLGFPQSGPSYVPPGLTNLSPITIDQTSEFDYVQIDSSSGSGSFSLTITNNLPVPIDFPHSIILRNNLANPKDTTTIAEFPIPTTPLPANGGQVTVANIPVNGKLLRGLLTTDPIQFHTSGSLPNQVNFTPSSGISVSLQSTTLYASNALAVIPSQTVKSSVDSVLLVDNLTVIQSAVFTKGKIIFNLKNNTGIDVGVNLGVNELKQNSTGYYINHILSANQTIDDTLDFSKISIQADLPLRQYGTTVKFSVNITTLNSEGAKKLVSKDDFVQASFIPYDPLVVKTVVGKIAPTNVQINSGVASGIKGKDLGDLSAQVAFKGMQFALNLLITSGFPTDYHLAFIAKNSNKIDSIILDSKLNSTDFPRIYPNGIDVAKIKLSNQPFNDFIGKFFPDVPDSFFVRGYLTMDPADIFAQQTTYSISDNTTIYSSFDLNLPVAMGINNGVMREVVAFGKGQLPKDFTKSVAYGTLTFDFYNKFPFKMIFHANFLGNYSPQKPKGETLLSIPSNFSDTTIAIRPAAVDINTGLTTTPTFSRASITLTGDQMVQFNKADSLFIQFDMSTSNNGQVVRVRDTDYIRVYAKGDITYTMGKQ